MDDDHLMIPVNADGDGPETDPALVDHYECWCGRPGCGHEQTRILGLCYVCGEQVDNMEHSVWLEGRAPLYVSRLYHFWCWVDG